jgi:hypothetical protein
VDRVVKIVALDQEAKFLGGLNPVAAAGAQTGHLYLFLAQIESKGQTLEELSMSTWKVQ